jgi:putative transposase
LRSACLPVRDGPAEPLLETLLEQIDLAHQRTITVTSCGRICIGRRKVNLSHVFAGQKVGIKEVSEKIWLVSFMQYDLGFFDEECGRVECAENPFGAKVSPMSPV